MKLEDLAEMELSPAQPGYRAWRAAEDEGAAEERRERLARYQRRYGWRHIAAARLRHWAHRHRYGILFWTCLVTLMAIEAVALWSISHYLVAL